MANVFQKGNKFAATALSLLTRLVKAPGLFTYKYGITDFAGAEGDVVNVRRPPLLRARDKGWRNNNAIVVDDIVKTTIQIALNQHPYSAVALTSEESTLDLVDYVRDVQAPQVQALLEYFEDAGMNALRAADFVYEIPFIPGSTGVAGNARAVALRARKYFQLSHVPADQRYWLVGADVSEAIASDDKLEGVANVDGLPEALRDGVVGRLRGFTVVELDSLQPEESFFVHATAIAWAAVAPVVPQGAAKGGGVAAGQGLAVTQVWDYDGDHLKDRSVVHAFVGAAAVLDPKVGDDGLIMMKDDKPVLEFVRAIKVVFAASEDDPEIEDEGGTSYTVTVNGAPTGGTYTLSVDDVETAPIAFNASNAAIKSAVEELDGIGAVKVSGPAGGPKTIEFTELVLAAPGTVALTGGTAPAVVVTEV